MDGSSETRRIAFFLPSLRGGGAERSVSNLAAGVAGRGLQVDLVLSRAEGPYLEGLPAAVQVVDLDSPRVFRSLPKLVRYLRRTRPDVLFSAMDHANIVALLAAKLAGSRTRIYASVHTMASIAMGRFGNIKSRLILFLRRFLYRWACGVVAISRGVAQDIIRSTGVRPEKVRVLYNPVVTSDLAGKAREAPQHRWLAHGEGPIILSVGRLTRAKDYPTLIRAFSILRQRRPAKLLILGEGEERPKLESLVRELGIDADVELPGFVPNPYSYMSRANVFVLSSAWEGLSCVLIEAMACGCPVVSTDCPSGPSETLENGRYGPLVPVGDAASLAEAIERLLDVPPSREELRSRAARYSVDAIVQEFLEIVR